MDITLQKHGARRTWRRLGLLAAGAALLGALALGGGTAEAATEVSRTGQIGRFTIVDQPGNPGAGLRCIYQPDGTIARLNRIIVGAPTVFARNATKSVDTQTVTYTATLMRVNPGASPIAVEDSPPQFVQATDATGTKFNVVSFNMLGRPAGQYFVHHTMIWRSFANPNLPDGSIALRHDNYAIDLERAPRDFFQQGSTTDGCATPLPRSVFGG
jgi:hypothetical protein